MLFPAKRRRTGHEGRHRAKVPPPTVVLDVIYPVRLGLGHSRSQRLGAACSGERPRAGRGGRRVRVVVGGVVTVCRCVSREKGGGGTVGSQAMAGN